MPDGIEEFQKRLEHWMTSPEGQDYCPRCWRLYLSKFREQEKEAVERDSLRTRDRELSKSRHLGGGWGTACEICKDLVFVPFSASEITRFTQKTASVGWSY